MLIPVVVVVFFVFLFCWAELIWLRHGYTITPIASIFMQFRIHAFPSCNGCLAKLSFDRLGSGIMRVSLMWTYLLWCLKSIWVCSISVSKSPFNIQTMLTRSIPENSINDKHRYHHYIYYGYAILSNFLSKTSFLCLRTNLKKKCHVEFIRYFTHIMSRVRRFTSSLFCFNWQRHRVPKLCRNQSLFVI